MSVPAAVGAIAQLTAIRAGLFLNPVGGPARHAIYFRPALGGTWERRVIPSTGGHCRLQFPGITGDELPAVCAERYRSTDGGRNWQPER
ncbi:MAG TPA: hypothetical protein VGA00_14455 [Acidiferrobacterales bacterium]